MSQGKKYPDAVDNEHFIDSTSEPPERILHLHYNTEIEAKLRRISAEAGLTPNQYLIRLIEDEFERSVE